MNDKGYEELARILKDAYNQAAQGKGKERHANDLPFHEQPMQALIAAHGIGFATGQAAKKLEESHGLDVDAAIKELHGAIVYAAGAVYALEQRLKVAPETANGMKITHVADNSPAYKPDLSIYDLPTNETVNYLLRDPGYNARINHDLKIVPALNIPDALKGLATLKFHNGYYWVQQNGVSSRWLDYRTALRHALQTAKLLHILPKGFTMTGTTGDYWLFKDSPSPIFQARTKAEIVAEAVLLNYLAKAK